MFSLSCTCNHFPVCGLPSTVPFLVSKETDFEKKSILHFNYSLINYSACAKGPDETDNSQSGLQAPMYRPRLKHLITPNIKDDYEADLMSASSNIFTSYQQQKERKKNSGHNICLRKRLIFIVMLLSGLFDNPSVSGLAWDMPSKKA